MRGARTLVIVVGAVAAAAALFLVLRPDTEDGTTAPSPTVTGPAPTGTTAASPPAATRRPPPPPARVRIDVRAAQPVGGVRRVTVAEGRRVILTVTSDVSDHVHLHGYDVIRDVGPGQPARLAFRATIVGTVEAELEDRRILLARITAQP